MKRFQAEYSENSITYWPAYEAGKIGIIFFVVIGTLFIATSIWTLLDNPSRKTYLGILVAFPLVVVALCSVFSLILRTMHTKIVVSKEGIGYFKSNVAIEKQISWKEVSAIYFSQDLWYGNKSCRIVFNKSLSPKLHERIYVILCFLYLLLTSRNFYNLFLTIYGKTIHCMHGIIN